MAPRTFKQVSGTLVAVLLLLLIAPWEHFGDSPPEDASVVASPGFYPPAPSTAVGMTPEWRASADSVDRICAVSYNQALGIEAQLERVAALRGWSDARLEKARLGVWNEQAMTILRSTEALGKPPKHADLFASWRTNVARRAGLRHQAAQAAGKGRWHAYRDFMNRIYPLKDRSDEIGQRFGLRICTSN